MAYFNACLASGGVLVVESREAVAMASLSTALDDGQDDPLNQFLASHAANLGNTQRSMQVRRILHFPALLLLLLFLSNCKGDSFVLLSLLLFLLPKEPCLYSYC